MLSIMAQSAAYTPPTSLQIHLGIQPWQLFLPHRLVGRPLASGTSPSTFRAKLQMRVVVIAADFKVWLLLWLLHH